jgi:predicted ArsR family transcriptional regulator
MSTITEKTALIMRELASDFDVWRSTPDLSDATGIIGQVVRENMQRLMNRGWVAFRLGERVGSARPWHEYRATVAGRRAIERELKYWTFTENA